MPAIRAILLSKNVQNAVTPTCENGRFYVLKIKKSTAFGKRASALTLFVPRVLANHADHAVASDNLAITTNLFD